MQAFVIGIDVRSGDIVKRITKLVMDEDEVMAQLYAMESECHGTLGETANWERGGIDDLGGELHYSLVSCQSVAPSELPALSNHLPLVKAPNRATEAEARVLVGIERRVTASADQHQQYSVRAEDWKAALDQAEGDEVSAIDELRFNGLLQLVESSVEVDEVFEVHSAEASEEA